MQLGKLGQGSQHCFSREKGDSGWLAHDGPVASDEVNEKSGKRSLGTEREIGLIVLWKWDDGKMLSILPAERKATMTEQRSQPHFIRLTWKTFRLL